MKLFRELYNYKLSDIQIKIFIGTVLVFITAELNYKLMTNFLCLAVIALILCWSMGLFASVGKPKQQESE